MKSKIYATLILIITLGFLSPDLYAMKTSPFPFHKRKPKPTLNLPTLVTDFSETKTYEPDILMHHVSLKNNTTPIGGVYFSLNTQTKDVCIEGLNIKDPYKRHGLGTKLMKETLSICENKGCHKVTLLACPSDKEQLPSLIRFYQNLGFTVDEDGASFGAAFMQKKLS